MCVIQGFDVKNRMACDKKSNCNNCDIWSIQFVQLKFENKNPQ